MEGEKVMHNFQRRTHKDQVLFKSAVFIYIYIMYIYYCLTPAVFIENVLNNVNALYQWPSKPIFN